MRGQRLAVELAQREGRLADLHRHRAARQAALEHADAFARHEAQFHQATRNVGTALRDTHGANVVVMGCAGMARYRKPLQDEVGVPVVEPTQAAVTMAIGRVKLNWAGLP